MWGRNVDISGWVAKRVGDDTRTGRIQYIILDPQGNIRNYHGAIVQYAEDGLHWSRSHNMEKVRKDMQQDIRKIVRKVGKDTVPIEIGERVVF